MKNFNKELYSSLKFIDISKVLSQDIWSIQNKKNKEKNERKTYLLLKNFIKIIHKSIFYKPKIKLSTNGNNDIFYIRTYSRSDVDEHSSYYENIDGTSLCILSHMDQKFDFINCIYSIFFLLKLTYSLKLVLNNKSIKLLSYNGLKLYFIFFSSISDSQKIFPKLVLHPKLVSFQQMTPTENMLCQLANINNLKTFALEQGIGFYKEDGYYWEKYPVTTYLNSVCKNILCWGEFSRTIFKKHTNARTFIIGKASLPNFNKFEEGVTFVFQNKDCESANKELFDIFYYLEKEGIPTSRWFKTKGDIIIKNSVGRDGPLRKIVIGCSSNLLLELGYLGLKVLITKNSTLANSIPKNITINDPIDVIQRDLNDYPHDSWKNFIECTGDESVKRYKALLFEN